MMASDTSTSLDQSDNTEEIKALASYLEDIHPPTKKSLIDLKNPELYINRELSFLQFNWRVLQQALDEDLPLLERIRFIFIFSNNLDEFFEVRVASLVHWANHHPERLGPDGLTPLQALAEISKTCHEMVTEQYRIFNDVLLPQLATVNIHFLRRSLWTDKQAQWIKDYFINEVAPVISPIGLDLAHPFPRLVNKSLHFIVALEGKDAFGRESDFAVVHMPRSLPRIIQLPKHLCRKGDNFVFLSAIIHANAEELFPGMKVKGCYQFRLTRDSDLFVDEDDVEDLANALKLELQSRDFGTSVRLELADNCPDKIAQFLLQKCNLTEQELYRVNGPVNLNRLLSLSDMVERPELKFKSFTPSVPKLLRAKSSSIFSVLKQHDILLHHPYQSFESVVNFIRSAAADPDVLAIKQTLYRSGSSSPVVEALIDAARSGKEVTAVVELRARFDEQANIEFANKLQDAGALVVYGVVGYKTHAKLCVVTRREKKKLRHYTHLGTGNYHAGTAKLYTDVGLLTANKKLCDDAQRVFLQLTGMGKAYDMKLMLQAPFTLHSGLINLIDQEILHKRAGKEGVIKLRMNSLTEATLIEKLYEASQAGVEIDLIIRGICCLRPGLKNISDNIRVRSIVGRFLEHSRVFYFANNGEPQVFASSADLMDRNLYHRVETCFPVTDEKLAKRLVSETIDIYLQDNSQSWELHSDGRYIKNVAVDGETPIRAQKYLLDHICPSSD
ncbi:polyphosphate kinase 1 [Pleionea litopenaei]|uniref:Polyphosphate kinase n=1 Tax=Pleionea litopenaei TaxID=3070815 RepID=A0AA51RR57_9GAMM|nr:polyphosphate kinase 1 [Pleionea sp. HL-JVS1]WMS85994.1 polyphosphate kinase 1 [Pleionea sp. HL-JVS1]